jgi:hypothetical protein
VLFVVLGGLLVARHRRLLIPHLLAAAWGVFIAASGGICPLTPLENWLRRRAGEGGYSGGFLEHYITPLLYPEGLTRELQWILAGIVIVMNAAVYGTWLVRRQRAPPDREAPHRCASRRRGSSSRKRYITWL